MMAEGSTPTAKRVKVDSDSAPSTTESASHCAALNGADNRKIAFVTGITGQVRQVLSHGQPRQGIHILTTA